MGRPIAKKYYDGSDSPKDFIIHAWFEGEVAEELATVVKQRGTGIYELTNGSVSGVFKLQDGALTAAGQACIKVNPHGVGETAAVATATTVLTDDVVTEVTITDGGSGYIVAPTVTLTGDGADATAEAVITDGVVTAINITNGGSGYTVAPTVSFTEPTGGDVEYVRVLHNRTVKTYSNNSYVWVVGQSTTSEKQAEII